MVSDGMTTEIERRGNRVNKSLNLLSKTVKIRDPLVAAFNREELELDA